MDMYVRISILFICTNSRERERGKEREKQIIYSIDLNKVCTDRFVNIYIYIVTGRGKDLCMFVYQHPHSCSALSLLLPNCKPRRTNRN